jgi:Cu/Zn superoxide dismutase
MRRGLLSIAAGAVVLAFTSVAPGAFAKTPPATPVTAKSPPVTAPSSTATPVPAKSSPTPTATASLTVKMAGANETPPVNTAATGTGKITVDATRNQLCWNLSVQKLQGTVTGAHIHRAPAGKAGPIVLYLSPPTGGTAQGCKGVGPPLARGIVKNPADYYVNVHTSKFPDGEIRGQL